MTPLTVASRNVHFFIRICIYTFFFVRKKEIKNAQIDLVFLSSACFVIFFDFRRRDG